jgi:sugar phosphate isomerase/epimerase
MEFEKIDGELIYDKLLSTLDPKLVKMQFQVSVISQGYHAADYFTKYPGRYISIHLQDWSPADNKQVAVGKGAVDWKKLFASAKKGGVKNYYVELNLDQMKESYPYLRNLKV